MIFPPGNATCPEWARRMKLAGQPNESPPGRVDTGEEQRSDATGVKPGSGHLPIGASSLAPAGCSPFKLHRAERGPEFPPRQHAQRSRTRIGGGLALKEPSIHSPCTWEGKGRARARQTGLDSRPAPFGRGPPGHRTTRRLTSATGRPRLSHKGFMPSDAPARNEAASRNRP